ncbi:alpha-L-arabinofuranosidase C-terminal domain-containing protein [Mucilaginibacter sp. FT3.2]|uniref:alpha-L-arabinofuranosidase C-terminal domain-containing protein n=1 Tax=Mucilaginibacter sp. FT3.2 TaxID=2723090 RepID=UPI00161AF10B|nr:alpha-L-arabinofuranosidase C-terminal domain-containing protein [Mucilaginibacter sp. FT3.2]MBB6231113.1 alpha-N-arabinofuranosidase [Mucilaginibacter sp. FT3.2]
MRRITTIAGLICFMVYSNLAAQETSLTLDLTKPAANVSPRLYGLMTEEINYSYDGGLYAELIRNRIFKDDGKSPVNWSVVQDAGGKGNIILDHKNDINSALTTCLQLTVEDASGRVGVANGGYWGIPVKPSTAYKASFYAKATDNAVGPLTVSIETSDGTVKFAEAQVTLDKGGWKKYAVTLNTAAGIKPTNLTRFVISTKKAGTYWFNLVSLFPPTFNNRPNGNRIDIMNLMADMKPSFLRFPGGNFLEGDFFATRFPWKTTLGALEDRPGHPGCWSYRASDGMGLLEFLQWCEDLKMEPLLAVYAGYTLKGDHMDAGPFLKPFVDEALEEIEYVTGDIHTKWGAKRAQDGHPEPFKLNYIEVGNEDGFDRSGSYEARFTQFYDAIKAKYPQLQIISTVGGRDPLGMRFNVKTSTPQVVDEHYYRTAWEMEEDAAHYDNYDRSGPKIFVGEWATREGSPTTNMNAAIGDAAWMTGMERNADHVIMSCYAPLFVNVNHGGMQWESDLIGYNALSSYGSPSYYAQKMFSTYLGNQVIAITGNAIPVQTRHATKKDSAARVVPKSIPALFYVATRDTKTNMLYIKVVNASGNVTPVTINLQGVEKIASTGKITVLKSDKPDDTNTIDEPLKIKPQEYDIKGIKKSFTRKFDPYSISILQIKLGK